MVRLLVILLSYLRLYRLQFFLISLSSLRRLNAYNPHSPSILLLSIERYHKSDLEHLVARSPFNVLALPSFIPTSIVRSTLKKRHPPSAFWNYQFHFLESRKQSQIILSAFLQYLCHHHKLEVVIGASVWYRQDADIGAAATRIGLPYIVLHKENLATTSVQRTVLERNFSSLGTFEGHTIVVHNESCKDCLIRSGFVESSRVRVFGAPRFDNLANTISIHQTPNNHALTFFSFHMSTGIYGSSSRWYDAPGAGLFNFFNSVHLTIAHAALRHPDVPFTIKTKWEYLWIPKIKSLISEHICSLDDIPNLIITADQSPDYLIQNSTVAVAYGSTTVIEPSILGIPVIVPFYLEAASTENADYVHFIDYLPLLTLASSSDQLSTLIDTELARPPRRIDPAPSISIFEREVAPLSGNSTENILNYIQASI